MRRSPRVLLAWAAAVVVMLLTVQVVAGDLGCAAPARPQPRRRRLGRARGARSSARHHRRRPTICASCAGRRPRSSADALRDPARRGRSRGRGRAAARRRRRARVTSSPGPEGSSPTGGARCTSWSRTDSSRRRVRSSTCSPRTTRRVAAGAGAPGRATVVARGAQVLTRGARTPIRSDRHRPVRESPSWSPKPRPGRSRTRRPIGDVALALAPATERLLFRARAVT